MGAGKIILEPKVKVDDIKINLDPNYQYGADKIIGEFGKNIPIIKIGEYVLNFGDIKHFNLRVAFNSVPKFNLTVNDEQYIIRENLKNNIDTCVIFIGFKDWYIKFNGKLNKSFSDVGDTDIELFGEIHNDKLLGTKQQVLNNKSISEILEQLCKDSDMGLFVVDNPDLNKKLKNCLQPGNIKTQNFIEYIIKNYTTNLFAFDCFYYLHVVDIDKLKTQSIDKYTLNWKDGIVVDEKDIIFKSIVKEGYDGDAENNPDDFKIPILYYSIDTNYTDIHSKSLNQYKNHITAESDEIIDINSNPDLGIGLKTVNNFFGFKEHNALCYGELINKKLAGNVIKIKTENIVFELTPFSVVGVELYLPHSLSKGETKLDELHSGKKIVINYEIDYFKNEFDDAKNFMTQTIEVI